MNAIRLAIILPTFNRIGMLRRTLASLEAQTFPHFTVYLHDDSSTDETRLLTSADFTRLNVEILREPKVPPPAQFSRMFYAVREEFVAMAHDDEVYHPEWLASIMACLEDPGVVLAYGQTLVVDAKTARRRFYRYRDPIQEGTFTGPQVRELFLRRQLGLPGNGFAIRTRALAQVAPFAADHVQFDYEWLARVADQGLTRVLPQLLMTYTVHASNTIGSISYVRRLLTQKSGDEMLMEWLRDMPQIPETEQARLQAWLRSQLANLEWLMFLRALSFDDKDLARSYGKRALSRPESRFLPRLLIRLALFPGLTGLAAWAVATVLRYRAQRPMLQRPDLEPVSPANAQDQFPTVALFASGT